MVVLVLSQSMERSLKICSKLEEQLHVCAPVQDIPHLMEILENNRESTIDLLLCDYYVFSPNSFNPYDSMRDLLKDSKVPFIFFNDPMLSQNEKSSFWEKSLSIYYPYTSSLNIQGLYRPFFMWLTINPFVERLLLEGTEIDAKPESEMELESLAREIGIPDSRLKLLMYFWKNQNKALCIADICRTVWNKEDDSCIQQLYTYISNLRQAFCSCIKYDMQIVRTGKNKYIFGARKRKFIDDDFCVRDFLDLPVKYKVEF